MAGKLNGYVLFFKGDGANSSVVGLISVFVMGYRGCYLCTLCALWCCHATILIDKLVACCHANMFNFSESIKPKSLHPGNTSIAQLDTMCCIGRAYVELATPRLFLQMWLFQRFLYLRNVMHTIDKYLCKKMKLFMWLQRIMLFSDNDVYTQITNQFQSGKMSLFPYSMVSYLEPQNLSLEGIDTRKLQARLSGQYLGHFGWFGSFEGCSPSPYHPCMVYLYYLH